MNSTLRKFTQTGFTLVELLIVVIILAILAAIVIPQFSSSTTDAQESALDANLASLRSAAELFHVQHAGAYPGGGAGSVGTSGATCTGAGAAAAGSAQAWMDHLLLSSDATGRTCPVGDPITFKFGPYIRKGIPADPITGKGAALADILATSTGAVIVVATTTTTGGWAVDTKSGQIVMNSGVADSKTKAYSTH